MIDLYDFWRWSHVVLFAIWLGSDLASAWVARAICAPTLAGNARTLAAKLGQSLEQWSHYCLVLMLPVGYALARAIDTVRVPDAVFAVLWIVTALWLLLLFAVRRWEGSRTGTLLRRLDIAWRCVLVFGLAWDAWQGFRGMGHIHAQFVAAKFALLAFILACSIAICVLSGPLQNALQRLGAADSSHDLERQLRARWARLGPLKLAIWIALLAAAYLGIAKPTFDSAV